MSLSWQPSCLTLCCVGAECICCEVFHRCYGRCDRLHVQHIDSTGLAARETCLFHWRRDSRRLVRLAHTDPVPTRRQLISHPCGRCYGNATASALATFFTRRPNTCTDSKTPNDQQTVALGQGRTRLDATTTGRRRLGGRHPALSARQQRNRTSYAACLRFRSHGSSPVRGTGRFHVSSVQGAVRPGCQRWALVCRPHCCGT